MNDKPSETNPSLKKKIRASYNDGVKCESATSVVQEVLSLEGSRKGKLSGEARKENAKQDREDVIKIAHRKLRDDVHKNRLASETAKQYPLSEHRVRDILKAEGLI